VRRPLMPDRSISTSHTKLQRVSAVGPRCGLRRTLGSEGPWITPIRSMPGRGLRCVGERALEGVSVRLDDTTVLQPQLTAGPRQLSLGGGRSTGRSPLFPVAALNTAQRGCGCCSTAGPWRPARPPIWGAVAIAWWPSRGSVFPERWQSDRVGRSSQQRAGAPRQQAGQWR